MALKLQGKDDRLKVGDFVAFGRRYEVPEGATTHMIANLCRRAAPWIARIGEIGLDERQTSALQREIDGRVKRLNR